VEKEKEGGVGVGLREEVEKEELVDENGGGMIERDDGEEMLLEVDELELDLEEDVVLKEDVLEEEPEEELPEVALDELKLDAVLNENENELEKPGLEAVPPPPPEFPPPPPPPPPPPVEPPPPVLSLGGGATLAVPLLGTLVLVPTGSLAGGGTLVSAAWERLLLPAFPPPPLFSLPGVLPAPPLGVVLAFGN